MSKEIPYYILNEDGKSEVISSNNEAYIDDNDLRELLIELLGDEVSSEDIQKILDATSYENMTEEEFDSLVDEFIFKNSNWVFPFLAKK